jgi:hypothetical protein
MRRSGIAGALACEGSENCLGFRGIHDADALVERLEALAQVGDEDLVPLGQPPEKGANVVTGRELNARNSRLNGQHRPTSPCDPHHKRVGTLRPSPDGARKWITLTHAGLRTTEAAMAERIAGGLTA